MFISIIIFANLAFVSGSTSVFKTQALAAKIYQLPKIVSRDLEDELLMCPVLLTTENIHDDVFYDLPTDDTFQKDALSVSLKTNCENQTRTSHCSDRGEPYFEPFEKTGVCKCNCVEGWIGMNCDVKDELPKLNNQNVSEEKQEAQNAINALTVEKDDNKIHDLLKEQKVKDSQEEKFKALREKLLMNRMEKFSAETFQEEFLNFVYGEEKEKFFGLAFKSAGQFASGNSEYDEVLKTLGEMFSRVDFKEVQKAFTDESSKSKYFKGATDATMSLLSQLFLAFIKNEASDFVTLGFKISLKAIVKANLNNCNMNQVVNDEIIDFAVAYIVKFGFLVEAQGDIKSRVGKMFKSVPSSVFYALKNAKNPKLLLNNMKENSAEIVTGVVNLIRFAGSKIPLKK